VTVKHQSEKSSSISSITRRDDDLLFTTDRSNMDYVTLSGVCKRTGAEESKLAVFLLGLIDNALDSTESYASPTSLPRSYGVMTITNHNVDCKHNEPQIHIDIKFDDERRYLVIIVKNSNFGSEESGFTEQRINSIFGDLDVFHSSKRNQFRNSRGMQGDALKEILCIPYALAAKYQSYFNKPLDEPLIIRNGFRKKFEIRVVVDKIARHNYADIQISKISSNKNSLTEVEVHIPYDPKLSEIVKPDVLFLVVKYALLNPHIGFHFSVVNADGSPPISNTSLTATQRLLTHASKKSSIYSYDLHSFENLIYGIADDNLIVYDVLRKDNDLFISIGQLKKEGTGKIHDIYERLHNAIPIVGIKKEEFREFFETSLII